ncbi:hypothetical protein QFC19_008764 [Naganishia cerealis]|uniref:Uncharacterized protein n=1 Tax=Naganishia cerealis TaxID=610337 RepID=A0ACC2UZ21_9TREE|nr:hypothetical protein QFC19_008764 [Naganishia cerealis]
MPTSLKRLTSTRPTSPDVQIVQADRAPVGQEEDVPAIPETIGEKYGEKVVASKLPYIDELVPPSLSYAKRGKNFGVVTYVRDDVKVLRTREVDWDKEGRVVVIELDGLAIYNVYALNGSEYPWNDPQTGKTRGSRNERKREFNRLLMEDVKHQRKNPQTPHIILVGDFNISLAAIDCFPRLRTEYPHNVARQEFNEQIIPGMHVVDVWRKIHGMETKGYSWFAVGKPHRSDAARVDYALVCEDAVDRVKSVEYLEKDQGRSDHCPLVLKFSMK